MSRSTNIINELGFTSSVDWRWISKLNHYLKASFSIEDTFYIISFSVDPDSIDNESWTMNITCSDTIGSNPLQLISTLSEIIKDFIIDYYPKYILLRSDASSIYKILYRLMTNSYRLLPPGYLITFNGKKIIIKRSTEFDEY
jgi:hypothetical protein